MARWLLWPNIQLRIFINFPGTGLSTGEINLHPANDFKIYFLHQRFIFIHGFS